MHLCVQGDQIGRKFMGLAPADMDRQPHLINTNKKVFSSKRPSPSAWTTPTLNLPCVQGKSPVFINAFSF
jgi:hypothetical protein